MEYLEGETLAHRLRRGPIPPTDAIRYAIEIADALDCAHRAGISHRDVKPANIMFTKEGAKLLNFGLAHRLRQPIGALSDGSQAWAKNGIIIFTPRVNDRIHKVHQNGGTPTPLTALDPGRDEDAHYWPEFLPDGTRFVFLRAADLRRDPVSLLDRLKRKGGL